MITAHITRVNACLALCAVSLACSGEPDTRSADTPTSRAAPVSAVSTTTEPSQRADDCPATGEWALCSVEKRLERSGFVATKLETESPSRAGFSVKPVAYRLGRGRLEVFIYDNAASMERDISRIDTLTVSPAGSTAEWPSTPTLIKNGNLAAVYMDQTARQAERLVMALTAGAPSGR
jgi:hypothetical protein